MAWHCIKADKMCTRKFLLFLFSQKRAKRIYTGITLYRYRMHRDDQCHWQFANETKSMWKETLCILKKIQMHRTMCITHTYTTYYSVFILKMVNFRILMNVDMWAELFPFFSFAFCYIHTNGSHYWQMLQIYVHYTTQ